MHFIKLSLFIFILFSQYLFAFNQELVKNKINKYKTEIQEPEEPQQAEVVAVIEDEEVEDSALEKAYMDLFNTEAFRHLKPSSANLLLEQKGYHVFKQKRQNSFVSSDQREFDSNFRLIAGDQLLIATYGNSDLEFEVEVDRNHNLFIPKVGVIQLGGLNFKDAQALITKKVKSYYLGSKVYIKVLSKTTRSVAVIGRINNPGMIHIGSGMSLMEAIFKAGGISKKGSLRNITVFQNGVKKSVDLYQMLLMGDWDPFVLTGGERINIPVLKNTVAVVGGVLDPGIYELSKHSTLYEIIQLAQGSSPLANQKTINVYRSKGFNNEIDTITVNYKDSKKFKLKAFDIVEVLNRNYMTGVGFSIQGAVNYPGNYELKKGETVASAIKRAGGLTRLKGKMIFLNRKLKENVYSERYDKTISVYDTEALQFSISDLKLKTIKLVAGDVIDIPKVDSIAQVAQIEIFGEVADPKKYIYQDNINLLELITLAKGVTEFANAEGITVARTLGENKVWHIRLPEKGSLREKLSSVKLEPGDVITVPKVSVDNILVTASGEFLRPGTYLLTKGARISDLIIAAGGLKESAFIKGAAFFRESVAQKYNERLGVLADKLEQDLLRIQSNSIQSGLKSENEKNAAVFVKQEQLIEKMRNTESTGRIAIKFDREFFEDLENENNILLENGDNFTLPTEPSTISIIGQVNNQNTVVYIPKFAVNDYINNAGGLTQFADKKNIFIIKANGFIVPANKVNSKNGSWIFNKHTGFNSDMIEPGDTIFVPEDYTIKVNGLQKTKDITQIIFQIITSIGVAVAAF